MSTIFSKHEDMKQIWDSSFDEQVAQQAYNTSPVEALVRSASYYLRERYSAEQQRHLHFLEVGCGAGPNITWAAKRGIKVSGIDISPTALSLCRETLRRSGLEDRVGQLVEGSVDDMPFENESFDVIFESCVFQHLERDIREKAFSEIRRLLKPGGLFAGYMLSDRHTVYQLHRSQESSDDPGTLVMNDGGSKIYITNIGLSHYFRKDEYTALLADFSTIEALPSTYYIPKSEAKKRGYEEYIQAMWIVYAIK